MSATNRCGVLCSAAGLRCAWLTLISAVSGRSAAAIEFFACLNTSSSCCISARSSSCRSCDTSHNHTVALCRRKPDSPPASIYARIYARMHGRTDSSARTHRGSETLLRLLQQPIALPWLIRRAVAQSDTARPTLAAHAAPAAAVATLPAAVRLSRSAPLSSHRRRVPPLSVAAMRSSTPVRQQSADKTRPRSHSLLTPTECRYDPSRGTHRVLLRPPRGVLIGYCYGPIEGYSSGTATTPSSSLSPSALSSAPLVTAPTALDASQVNQRCCAAHRRERS